MHIFDMDGTLIDSNGIWREVDEAFLAKRGFPYTKEYYQGVAHTISRWRRSSPSATAIWRSLWGISWQRGGSGPGMPTPHGYR